jgi:transmembrane 9 superfamily protein 3
LGDEYGWKQVHGDVFRPAAHPMLFSALLGTGYQLLVVTVAVILFTILGELYTERGSLLSTAIFVYAATAPINGYFGSSIYSKMGGKVSCLHKACLSVIRSVLQTAALIFRIFNGLSACFDIL